MQERLDRLPPRLANQRTFLTTYTRTTNAVGVAIRQGRFADPAWVERWGVVFADLYLVAWMPSCPGNARRASGRLSTFIAGV